jgi:hypothetical protein
MILQCSSGSFADRVEWIRYLLIEVLPADGSPGIKTRVGSGCFFVVPRGRWHRQYLMEHTKEFYLTPGRTLHSKRADPRNDSQD